MPEVCLVYLPFGPLERPSLAIGVLKVALREAGISCDAVYTNFDFASRIGIGTYQELGYVREEMIGEWVFAGAAFPDFHPDHDAYLERVASTVYGGAKDLALALWRVRHEAGRFIDEAAAAIAARKPRIVAVSSTFNQNCASIAFTRRLKEIHPSIITIVGGANCESEMGLAMARHFDGIDYVISGEAEENLPQLCQRLLEHGVDAGPGDLPYGVFSRHHALPSYDEAVPRAQVKHLDTCPIPDFTDFFDALAQFPDRDCIEPGLLIETARGCWWGQVHHCTFCGLNGGSMTFRAKSPERAVREFTELSTRYGIYRFLVVDNIIDTRYFREVLPHLARLPDKLTLYYEVKANLTYAQMQALRDSGSTWIQPGIESLHDELLQRMEKGTWTWINVQLLKWARELGLHVSWNILCGFPGEEDAWYQEMADWLPLIHHLQPTKEVRPVRFDRFSPHQAKPEKYGLRLRPAWPYAYVYPLSERDAARLVYVFEDDGYLPLRTNATRTQQCGSTELPTLGGPGRDALRDAVIEWIRRFNARLTPMLCMTEEDDRTSILDTRAVAPQRRVELTGLAHRVHRLLDRANTLDGVLKGLPADTSPDEVRAVLDDLVARKLVMQFGGRWLALAIRGSVPALPRSNEDGYPGGWISRRRAPAMARA